MIHALLILLSVAITYAAPPEPWLKHRKVQDEEAGGPKGYLAIQSFVRINKGQKAWLHTTRNHEKAKLSTDPGNSEVHANYDGSKVTLHGEGATPIELLAAPDQTHKLKNGFSIRSGKPRDDGTVFIRLLNDRRSKYKRFKSFPYFPYDPKGVVPAKLEKSISKEVSYIDTLGLESKVLRVGTLRFRYQDKEYGFPAYAFGEPDNLNILFTDRTSGTSTYGGGRVVYMEFPDKKLPDELTIDFNFAYAFLCAHAQGFRCPNRLTQKIDAEMKFGEQASAEGH